MRRRTFTPVLGAAMAGAAFAQQSRKTRIYALDQFFLKNGTQAARLHEFLSKGFVPFTAKAGIAPVLVMDALIAPHMPQVAMVTGYETIGTMNAAMGKLEAEETYRKSFEAWETAAEPPYEHFSRTLLQPAPYSPEVVVNAEREKPRLFELRVYHSPTWRQLVALHERFAGPEIRIFQRVGVHPILYTSTVAGAHMPNLTYITPFDNLAAREKAWEAFAADPEWIKVRKESIDKHGQISSVIQIAVYRAAAYSPVK